MDRDYPSWETNEQTIQDIEHVLLDTLVVDHDLGQLMQDDEFADAVRTYLIENYA